MDSGRQRDKGRPDGSTIERIETWFTHETLGHGSVAAVDVAGEILGLQKWLPRWGLRTSPFWAPHDGPPEEIPGFAREMLVAAEEFREAVARHARIPFTLEEVRVLVGRRVEKDEITAFDQLQQLGPVPASIVIRLQIARDELQEAFDRAQNDRAPQLTLTTVSGAPRSGVHFAGRALSSVGCQREESPDPLEHLLRRYHLERQLLVGLEASDSWPRWQPGLSLTRWGRPRRLSLT